MFDPVPNLLGVIWIDARKREKRYMEIHGFQKEKEFQISSNGGFYKHKHTSSVNCLEGIHSMIQYGLVQK